MKRKNWIAAILISATTVFGVGVLSVQAAPVCQRIVHEYRETLAHHPVSRATAARWAIWNAAHPNYHPKPRRRPALSPQETVSLVNFACQVPLENTEIAGLLPPEPLSFPDFSAEILIPSVPPVAQPISLLNVPLIAPPTPITGETPEPASIILLGTAMIALLYHQRKKHALSR